MHLKPDRRLAEEHAAIWRDIQIVGHLAAGKSSMMENRVRSVSSVSLVI